MGVQSTLSVTAGDGAELIGLREVTDSDFPSRATVVMNSSVSVVEYHHMHVHVLLVLSLHLRHFLVVTPLHDARNSIVCLCGSPPVTTWMVVVRVPRAGGVPKVGFPVRPKICVLSQRWRQK